MSSSLATSSLIKSRSLVAKKRARATSGIASTIASAHSSRMCATSSLVGGLRTGDRAWPGKTARRAARRTDGSQLAQSSFSWTVKDMSLHDRAWSEHRWHKQWSPSRGRLCWAGRTVRLRAYAGHFLRGQGKEMRRTRVGSICWPVLASRPSDQRMKR